MCLFPNLAAFQCDLNGISQCFPFFQFSFLVMADLNTNTNQPPPQPTSALFLTITASFLEKELFPFLAFRFSDPTAQELDHQKLVINQADIFCHTGGLIGSSPDYFLGQRQSDLFCRARATADDISPETFLYDYRWAIWKGNGGQGDMLEFTSEDVDFTILLCVYLHARMPGMKLMSGPMFT